MISNLDLKELLPVWYVGIKETDILMDVENDLLEQLRIQIQKVQDNQYVSTADSKTISIYEEMLGITTQQGDTLEMRRFRVLTRMTSQVPYTLGYLKELLSSFGGKAEATMFYNEYRLLVETEFEKKGQITELDYIFKKIVPANIAVEARNFVKGETDSNNLIAVGMTVTELIEIR